jgi:hypothetical protein
VESRTLAQLRAEVAYLSDTESLTARHPTADVTRRLNAQIRALRGLLTANGLPYYIETTSATTLAGTAVSGEQYCEVPFPADAVQILGVDVASDASAQDWYQLAPITWAARRNARWYGVGQPRYFAIRRLPQANPLDLDAVQAGAIALFPNTDQGVYKISYLPDHVDLAAEGDLFLGLPEAIQWVVWSVVQDLAARDDDQRETYAIAGLKKAEAEARLLASVGRVQSAGPLLPRRRGRRFGR